MCGGDNSGRNHNHKPYNSSFKNSPGKVTTLNRDHSLQGAFGAASAKAVCFRVQSLRRVRPLSWIRSDSRVLSFFLWNSIDSN